MCVRVRVCARTPVLETLELWVMYLIYVALSCFQIGFYNQMNPEIQVSYLNVTNVYFHIDCTLGSYDIHIQCEQLTNA